MKEPTRPFKSGKFSYCPDHKDEALISKLYVHPDFMEEIEEKLLDEDQAEGDEAYIKPQVEEWWYDTEFVTLQDILNIVPTNTDPKNIIITIHRDREIRDIGCKVSIRTQVDKEAWQLGHDAEQVEYEEKLAAYEAEKKKYDQWKTEEEIKQLQSKLDKLKK